MSSCDHGKDRILELYLLKELTMSASDCEFIEEVQSTWKLFQKPLDSPVSIAMTSLGEDPGIEGIIKFHTATTKDIADSEKKRQYRELKKITLTTSMKEKAIFVNSKRDMAYIVHSDELVVLFHLDPRSKYCQESIYHKFSLGKEEEKGKSE